MFRVWMLHHVGHLLHRARRHAIEHQLVGEGLAVAVLGERAQL
jgi:hypothetical protein